MITIEDEEESVDQPTNPDWTDGGAVLACWTCDYASSNPMCGMCAAVAARAVRQECASPATKRQRQMNEGREFFMENMDWEELAAFGDEVLSIIAQSPSVIDLTYSSEDDDDDESVVGDDFQSIIEGIAIMGFMMMMKRGKKKGKKYKATNIPFWKNMNKENHDNDGDDERDSTGPKNLAGLFKNVE